MVKAGVFSSTFADRKSSLLTGAASLLLPAIGKARMPRTRAAPHHILVCEARLAPIPFEGIWRSSSRLSFLDGMSRKRRDPRRWEGRKQGGHAGSISHRQPFFDLPPETAGLPHRQSQAESHVAVTLARCRIPDSAHCLVQMIQVKHHVLAIRVRPTHFTFAVYRDLDPTT
jgi:hypothetical protein